MINEEGSSEVVYIVSGAWDRDGRRLRDSIVVSISACHVEDPGSIPGRGAGLLP